MNRYKSREQAFCFIFEGMFGNRNLEEIIKNAKISGADEISDFAQRVFLGVEKNTKKIEEIIENNLKKWRKERLPRTTLAILKLAVFELIFESENPGGVVINEAVELAKKFSTTEDANYINGVLSSIYKKTKENI